MAKIIIPCWNDIKEISGRSISELLICSPYYSQTALDKIVSSLKHSPKILFWTRVSFHDWVNNQSDPEALINLYTTLKKHNIQLEISSASNLHAKAYGADNNIFLVGSSNLTTGGFINNLEIMVRFEEDEAKSAIAAFKKAAKDNINIVDVNKLIDWVNTGKQYLYDIRQSRKTDEIKLRKIQSKLDKILIESTPNSVGYLRGNRKNISAFTKWLKTNKKLAGAKVLLTRCDNTDGQNLTGHFKQCYFGVTNFLLESPSLIKSLSSVLDNMDINEIYQPAPKVMRAWLRHMGKHASELNNDFSYVTLANILPSEFGGNCVGGGGGIGTLKRMIPLVSKFMIVTKKD
jgi:hypothetical protein